MLGGQTKVGMSQTEKARIGKGLGFNLCVVPRPMLSPYFGSGGLRSEQRNTKAEAENFRGTQGWVRIWGKVVVDIQTGD